MKYHQIVEEIQEILERHGVHFEFYEHKPVVTSEEAAAVRKGYSIKEGAKAIIVRVRVKKSLKKFAMLVLPGDARFDNRKIKAYFETTDVSLAAEKEVLDITRGIEPGGIPPFGNLFGLEVIADPTLFDNERMIFSAGDRRVSIGMRSDDFKKIVAPKIESII